MCDSEISNNFENRVRIDEVIRKLKVGDKVGESGGKWGKVGDVTMFPPGNPPYFDTKCLHHSEFLYFAWKYARLILGHLA